ncbi:type III PLP-dependent enzyme [Streptomyces sp. ODS05-4]|uniref:type III PLP-dependent enzyme n=1 Tax=Streptomyces sp. ODS05-4 TaxID=2944939 RepID=UPI00210A36B7|nr:type III PLP-dependent enzyme [Streptomyces sp. ODS05-4]
MSETLHRPAPAPHAETVPHGLATPAYVYDLALVRSAHQRLRAWLPEPSELYYSLKANPHPDVVAALHALGCRAEVSSPGELDAALTAGVPARDILYTGPGKRDEDLHKALTAGVRDFAVDSAFGIGQLDRAAARHGVHVTYLLRVNPGGGSRGAGLRMTGDPSAFGADAQDIAAHPGRYTGGEHARIDGLHLYLATNITDEQALGDSFSEAVAVARTLREALGVPLRTIDLGGGFGAPYARAGDLPDYPGLADRLAGELDEALPGWRHNAPTVAFESGRYLTATCGQLLTRVLDVKDSHGQRVVVLDTGINHLGGMAGLRRVPPLHPDVVRPATDSAPTADAAEPPGPAMICGPLCTPLDTWARSHPLPAVAPGDLLAVPNTGAYGLHASLVLFLGHPAPLEVVTDSGRVLRSDRMTFVRRPADS